MYFLDPHIFSKVIVVSLSSAHELYFSIMLLVHLCHLILLSLIYPVWKQLAIQCIHAATGQTRNIKPNKTWVRLVMLHFRKIPLPLFFFQISINLCPFSRNILATPLMRNVLAPPVLLTLSSYGLSVAGLCLHRKLLCSLFVVRCQIHYRGIGKDDFVRTAFLNGPLWLFREQLRGSLFHINRPDWSQWSRASRNTRNMSTGSPSPAIRRYRAGFADSCRMSSSHFNP